MGQLRNPHPGEILKEEFLNEIGVSQNQLAKAIGVPGNRVHAIVKGTRDITADTDLRLCKFFGLTEGYFLRLQMPTTQWRLSVRLRVRWRRSTLRAGQGGIDHPDAMRPTGPRIVTACGSRSVRRFRRCRRE